MIKISISTFNRRFEKLKQYFCFVLILTFRYPESYRVQFDKKLSVFEAFNGCKHSLPLNPKKSIAVCIK